MAETQERRVRNPQGTGQRLRDELIHAADRILARTGDEAGLSLRAVAREAGIATPSIYLHFADKQALVRAVLDTRAAEMTQAVDVAISGVTQPVERVRAGCVAYCTWGLANPNAYRVLFGNRSTVVLDTTIAHLPGGTIFLVMVQTIDQCMEEQGAPAADPLHVATSVWTALHGIVMLRDAVPSFPWPPLVTQVEDVLVGLVGVARHSHRGIDGAPHGST